MTKRERAPGSLLYWLEWARGREGLRVAEKAVLLVLATRADNNGECYPGIKLLAQEASLSERAAREAVKSLEAAGLLRRSSRYRGGEGTGGRRSNIYTLTPATAGSTGTESTGLEAAAAANPLQETAGLEAAAAGAVETTRETTRETTKGNYQSLPHADAHGGDQEVIDQILDDLVRIWPTKLSNPDRRRARGQLEYKMRMGTPATEILDGARRYRAECIDLDRADEMVAELRGWIFGERWEDASYHEEVSI